MNPWVIWERYWFLFAILIVILLAEIRPEFGIKEGPLKPEITIKYVAVSMIYFLSGLSLKTEDLVCAAKQFELHIFIQTFSLIFVPMFVKFITTCLMSMSVDEWVLKGLVVASCMPQSASSPAILTRLVGGNEAAAIFNSLLGTILGIIATPFTLLFFLRATVLISPLATILNLFLRVTIPLGLGQIFRYLTGIRVTNQTVSRMGQIALLMSIYTTFCDAFSSQDIVVLEPVNIVVSVFLVVVLQIVLLYLSFLFATYLNLYSPQDIVAILFCSTHKSLTLAIPMLRVLYSGYAHLYTISLPLMIYYPTQIILGNLLVGDLQCWLRRKGSLTKRIANNYISKLLQELYEEEYGDKIGFEESDSDLNDEAIEVTTIVHRSKRVQIRKKVKILTMKKANISSARTKLLSGVRLNIVGVLKPSKGT